jgi:outer membrane protein OmpA-like peptidoglycan-associated protein
MNALLTRSLVAVGTLWVGGVLISAQSPTAPAAGATPRSIKAIGYEVGKETTVDLKATTPGDEVEGEAKVVAAASTTRIEAKVKKLRLPTPFGTEFLAYVMWAVSPEGRAVNLGELRPDDDGKAELEASGRLQSFSLFVTAEPYPAVRQPSEIVVLENEVRKGTKGKIFVVENFPLMKRSAYQKMDNALGLSLDLETVPLEMYHARNAVEIAKARGAERYAGDVYRKAQGALELAEDALTRKANKREIISLALQTQQTSEDARALTAERIEQERIASERAAAADEARAQAEDKARAEAAVAARQQAELAAAREAQLKAEAAARQAEAARQEAQLRADAAATKAQADADAAAAAAREGAATAEAERARQASEKLRAELLDQFNRVLSTRDTSRGLVITMADVLFDTGKYEVKPTTREALARLSGIVLAHSGLNLEVQGHTDSTGSDALNQTLSEQRAAAVRGYLIQQGVADDTITARGLGKSVPVADNATAAGRQQNRRVELIVSGEVIGVKIGN